MSFKAILYAYILGGITFIPLVLCGLIAYTIYTSVPVEESDVPKKPKLPQPVEENPDEATTTTTTSGTGSSSLGDVNDIPRTRRGWLTVRRTFEEESFDGSYVTLVRSFLDARSKDPKRSRPKDMWYVVLKGKIMYLYEDEAMTECEAVIQLGDHEVVIYPEGQLDGELFAKRNAICLKPAKSQEGKSMPSLTKEMLLEDRELEEKRVDTSKLTEKEKERLQEVEKTKKVAREQALDFQTPWFIFVRSTVEMEDWYLALIHASRHPAQTPQLSPLHQVFSPADMNHLVSTLDEQPDIIPMRWFNALFGRIFYSFYRTRHLEDFIIARLMKKLSKVKRPAMLADIVVTEVSVGNKTPVFSKPMLKELTREGDASMEVHLYYKGEIRITVEATAIINLGARFKSYTVKLVLAAVLKEIEGNLLVKVKRPPSNRLWYAFTQPPRMVLSVEPIVSDRQITWTMILSTIEAKLKEIIQESIVMPNMDDIAFFETLAYQNRGGIYSDAGRRPREKVRVPTEDKVTGESVSVVQTAPTDEDEAIPQSLEKGQSLNEAPLVETSSTTSLPLTKSSTAPEDSSAAQRRKTWFSSVRNADSSAAAASLNDIQEDEDAQRGRTLEVENSLLPRSHSTPNQPEGLRSSPSRSSSRSSTKRSVSQHSNQSPSTPSDVDSIPIVRSESPNPISDAGKSNLPPQPTSPTSSILATLKSRTGDKQALTNTAKEAMRKWGVNWGGLNKNTSPNASTSSGGSNSEEMPDHGSVGSRVRSDSFGTLTQRARTSYAEVRAAVAERRNKQASSEEQREANSRDPSPPSLSVTPSDPSSATPTPSTPAKTNSLNLAVEDNTSDHDPTTTAPTRPTGTSSSQHHPIHIQPQAKTMSIPGIHAKNRGEVMSMGYVAPQESSPKPDNKVKGNNPRIQSMYRLFKTTALSTSPGSTGSGNQQSDGNKSEDDDRDELLDFLPPPSQENRDEQSSPSSSVDSHSISSTPFPSESTLSKSSSPSPTPRPTSISFSLPIVSSSPTRPPTGPPLPPRPTSISITRPPLAAQTSSSSSITTMGGAGGRSSFSGSRSISISGTRSPNHLGFNGLGSLGQSSASDALKSIATKDENTRVRRAVSISGSPTTQHERKRSSGSESSSPPTLAPSRLSPSPVGLDSVDYRPLPERTGTEERVAEVANSVEIQS
ncbi:hypothetical protein K435DRAFT_773260 [Dendrothele bispora CBS 962.96]|uniref:SMP-LTD domain-containing protein n=1 Tax=Dendrothele bispora (strain CBS 962.96) TaxID=1314807 RepID=A0A4S8MTN7_DENBC|nr:hypothetical protein K435DRAFT_773260 [Dendrothele bispora CBS 962.96]